MLPEFLRKGVFVWHPYGSRVSEEREKYYNDD
jgi:hypothetical protein